MKIVYLTTAMVLTLLMLAPSIVPARLVKHSSHSRHSHKHNHRSHHRRHQTRLLRREMGEYTDLATEQRTIHREISEQLATMMQGKPSTIQVAGSRLPDCSNACGSCKPCKLVMVSFVCASTSEAESCPMAYKCMCRNKSYPVP